jgi:hypothetical protein
MTSAIIKFEDLPPEGRGRMPSDTSRDIANQLKERPGDWAHIRSSATSRRAASLAHHIRTGTSHAFRPKGAFDAKARLVDGQFRVYACYIGPNGEHQ